MGRSVDLTGRTFGYLKVIRRQGRYVSPKGRTAFLWLCECRLCGAIVVQRGDRLKSGDVVSCGCYKEKLASERMRALHRKEKENEHAD